MGRTAKRFSRFLDGRVDGENQSFRSIVCLMMFSLLRMAFTRDSAEPDIVSGPGTLSALSTNCTIMNLGMDALYKGGKDEDVPFEGDALGRPVPQRHVVRVDKVEVGVQVEEVVVVCTSTAGCISTTTAALEDVVYPP